MNWQRVKQPCNSTGGDLVVNDRAARQGPVVAPGGTDQIRVPRLAQSAVITAQCPKQVAIFDIQIMTQDGAAVAQVDAQMEHSYTFEIVSRF